MEGEVAKFRAHGRFAENPFPRLSILSRGAHDKDKAKDAAESEMAKLEEQNKALEKDKERMEERQKFVREVQEQKQASAQSLHHPTLLILSSLHRLPPLALPQVELLQKAFLWIEFKANQEVAKRVRAERVALKAKVQEAEALIAPYVQRKDSFQAKAQQSEAAVKKLADRFEKAARATDTNDASIDALITEITGGQQYLKDLDAQRATKEAQLRRQEEDIRKAVHDRDNTNVGRASRRA